MTTFLTAKTCNETMRMDSFEKEIVLRKNLVPDLQNGWKPVLLLSMAGVLYIASGQLLLTFFPRDSSKVLHGERSRKTESGERPRRKSSDGLYRNPGEEITKSPAARCSRDLPTNNEPVRQQQIQKLTRALRSAGFLRYGSPNIDQVRRYLYVHGNYQREELKGFTMDRVLDNVDSFVLLSSSLCN